MNPTKLAIAAIERGLVPDALTRMAIRRLLAERLSSETARTSERQAWIASLDEGPIAIDTERSKEQHYELPPAYFETVLGPHLKYSSCLWEDGTQSLEEAERAMLALTCERAMLENGQAVLELGCGWGSLSLWMAEHYPESRITAVSHSAPQRRHIEARAEELGLGNLEVITADMRDFDIAERFDRVVSVEMFEHMRNYRELMRRIATWLEPHGKLFVHIFTHRELAYPFEDEGEDDWMARYFFTGGTMPSDGLLLRYQDELTLEQRWVVNGTHYQKTLEAWLAIQDRRSEEVRRVFTPVYGADTEIWINRWRLFYIACAELFGYRGGNEWRVCHYLFTRSAARGG